MLDTMGDGVAVVDSTLERVQFLNRAAEKLTGCTNADSERLQYRYDSCR